LVPSIRAVVLTLAAVGIYGVVTYAVGRRVREIGVRIALGAATGDAVALVLRQQLRPLVIGAAIGVIAALAVSRILSSVLFGHPSRAAREVRRSEYRAALRMSDRASSRSGG
jgi:ABC-type antimicrobial peptide transport system permease subunit